VAGSPSCGSTCAKSLIDRPSAYSGSSRAPSIRMGHDTGTARIVARPSASREMTSGGAGGGGPLNANVGGTASAGAPPAVSGPWAVRVDRVSRSTAIRMEQPRRLTMVAGNYPTSRVRRAARPPIIRLHGSADRDVDAALAVAVSLHERGAPAFEFVSSKREDSMAIHKVIEVISQSEKSWEDAAQRAVSDAGKTVNQVKSIWIKNFEGVVKDNRIVEYRVNANITFEVK